MKFFKILVLVSILFCSWLFIRATDVDKTLASLKLAGPGFILLIAVTFIAYLCGTIGWKYCMGHQANHVSVLHLFFIRHLGETLGMINPTGVIAGEAAKVYLLKDSGIGQQTVLASLLSSRAIMVITQLVLFALALCWLLLVKGETVVPLHWQGPSGISFLILLAVVLVAWLLFVWIKRRKARGKKIFLAHKIQSLTGQLSGVSRSLSQLFKHHKSAMLLSFGFFTLHWIFGSLEFYLILQLLGLDVSPVQALLVDMGVMFFKAAGMFIPGQIGIEEYGNKVMLAAIGFPGAEIWITASVLRRLRQLTWLLFGLGLYLFTRNRWSHILTAPDGNPVR